MIETPALWFTVAAMVPLMVLMAYYDLKYLIIPNALVLTVFVVFLVTGLWGLPTDVFGWRLLHGLIVLVIGFGLFALGAVGGGDVKMASALTPYVAGGDAVRLLVLYAIIALVLVAVLRLVMQFARHSETGWLAIDQLKKPARERDFPMGLIFAMTIVVYLCGYLVTGARIA